MIKMNKFENFKNRRSPSINSSNTQNSEHIKGHLCPKCNHSYDVFTRNNFCVGKVPLILNCYHTVCEECVTSSIVNQQIVCTVCNKVSIINTLERRNVQEIFPVNFYILGLIKYCKPNSEQFTALKLRPAGVKYSEFTQSNLVQNNSINDTIDLLRKPIQEKCSQEGCKRSANVHCVECDELYCTPCCDTLHKSARGLKTHKIASINDFAPRLTAKCNVHTDHFLEVFCTTCRKIACCDCIVEEHNGHNFYKLSDLNVLGNFDLDELVAKAEDKLKKLLLAHKKTSEELNRSVQPSHLEAVVGKCFLHAHAQLQLLEKKLRSDIEQFNNQNKVTLNNISQELALNIRKLDSLIKSVTNVRSANSDAKFDIRAITESLENALSLPCYLAGQCQDSTKIEFQYQDGLNLEDHFILNFKECGDNFRLVLEGDLPDSFDATLSTDMISDISNAVDSHSSLSNKSAVSERLSNPTNLPMSNPNVSLKSSQIEGWIKSTQNNMPSIGDRENVVVSHIDNPECFYTQFNRFENAFQDLSVEIQQYARTYSLPVNNIEINKLYIVKYGGGSFDSKWYRGRVIQIENKPNGNHLYTIFFIDYGNTTIVTSNNVLNISHNLAYYQPFAHECKLFNIYPVVSGWDSKATLHMAKIVNDSNVIMVIMGQKNGILEVDLLSVSNVQTTSIRDALIFVGLGISHYDSSSESVSTTKTKTFTKLHTRTNAFRNGDTLMVVICHIDNPSSLYVQAADFTNNLESLTRSMANYYNRKSDKERMYGQSRNEHIYVPRKGMVVAVYAYSKWARATVVKVVKGAGTVTVFLEDYGKSATIEYTQIRKLPERFRNLECQAIHVKLADIKPKSKTWDVKATEFLHQFQLNNKSLRLLIVNVDKVPSAALYECYGTMEVCINTSLVEEGLAVSTGNISKSLQHVSGEEAPSTSIKKEKNYVFDLLDTIQCSKNKEDNSSDSDQENVIRKPVKVLSVKSPDEVFVEIEDPVIQKMQYELHQSMQEYYTNQKCDNKMWKINEPCVAYNPVNKQYFRGIILEQKGDNYKVMLRDVAEEIVIPECNIYELQSQFKQFREKAVRCHLACITPAGGTKKWSGLAVDFLQKIFEKHTKIFMTKNGTVDRNRKSVPVVMWYSEVKLEGPLEPSKTVLYNINKLLVKNGLAFKEKTEQLNGSTEARNHQVSDKTMCSTSKTPNRDPSQVVRPTLSELSANVMENRSATASPNIPNFKRISPNVVEQSVSPSHSKSFHRKNLEDNDATDNIEEQKENLTDWLPPISFKSKTFLAFATFVDYDACIYIHESIKEPVLKTMEDEMKKYFGNTSPEPMDTVWVPGQLCTVKYFVNDNWYRGKIVSVAEDSITVFLIDYGNQEECKHEDLRLKVMYLDLPAFASKIQLYQVFPKSLTWLTSDLDELHKKIVDNEIHVNLKKIVKESASPAIVRLCGVNINQYMRDYSPNLIVTSKKWADDIYESDDDVIIENHESDDVVIESEPNAIDDTYIQNSLPESLVGQTINVTVISVINYNEFVLEILFDQNIKETKRLFDDISKDIAKKAEQQPLLTDFIIGTPCVAKFSEDGNWYRGEIIDVKNIELKMVNVWFVDYGNSENVSTQLIRSLHSDWLELPILQYKAKIHGIVLADPSCLDLVLDCMSDCCNTLKMAQIISVNPLSVKLYDDNNQLVYQDLIDQQLLIKID